MRGTFGGKFVVDIGATKGIARDIFMYFII